MNFSASIIDYLNDILEAGNSALAFVAGMDLPGFLEDKKTQFAVIRALEIIGEAAKKISGDIRRDYPEVPWRVVTGMRDKMIHGYTGVNLVVVWKTLMEDLPVFLPIIINIIKDLERKNE